MDSLRNGTIHSPSERSEGSGTLAQQIAVFRSLLPQQPQLAPLLSRVEEELKNLQEQRPPNYERRLHSLFLLLNGGVGLIMEREGEKDPQRRRAYDALVQQLLNPHTTEEMQDRIFDAAEVLRISTRMSTSHDEIQQEIVGEIQKITRALATSTLSETDQHAHIETLAALQRCVGVLLLIPEGNVPSPQDHVRLEEKRAQIRNQLRHIVREIVQHKHPRSIAQNLERLHARTEALAVLWNMERLRKMIPEERFSQESRKEMQRMIAEARAVLEGRLHAVSDETRFRFSLWMHPLGGSALLQLMNANKGETNDTQQRALVESGIQRLFSCTAESYEETLSTNGWIFLIAQARHLRGIPEVSRIKIGGKRAEDILDEIVNTAQQYYQQRTGDERFYHRAMLLLSLIETVGEHHQHYAHVHASGLPPALQEGLRKYRETSEQLFARIFRTIEEGKEDVAAQLLEMGRKRVMNLSQMVAIVRALQENEATLSRMRSVLETANRELMGHTQHLWQWYDETYQRMNTVQRQLLTGFYEAAKGNNETAQRIIRTVGNTIREMTQVETHMEDAYRKDMHSWMVSMNSQRRAQLSRIADARLLSPEKKEEFISTRMRVCTTLAERLRTGRIAPQEAYHAFVVAQKGMDRAVAAEVHTIGHQHHKEHYELISEFVKRMRAAYLEGHGHVQSREGGWQRAKNVFWSSLSPFQHRADAHALEEISRLLSQALERSYRDPTYAAYLHRLLAPVTITIGEETKRTTSVLGVLVEYVEDCFLMRLGGISPLTKAEAEQLVPEFQRILTLNGLSQGEETTYIQRMMARHARAAERVGRTRTYATVAGVAVGAIASIVPSGGTSVVGGIAAIGRGIGTVSALLVGTDEVGRGIEERNYAAVGLGAFTALALPGIPLSRFSSLSPRVSTVLRGTVTAARMVGGVAHGGMAGVSALTYQGSVWKEPEFWQHVAMAALMLRGTGGSFRAAGRTAWRTAGAFVNGIEHPFSRPFALSERFIARYGVPVMSDKVFAGMGKLTVHTMAGMTLYNLYQDVRLLSEVPEVERDAVMRLIHDDVLNLLLIYGPGIARVTGRLGRFALSRVSTRVPKIPALDKYRRAAEVAKTAIGFGGIAALEYGERRTIDERISKVLTIAGVLTGIIPGWMGVSKSLFDMTNEKGGRMILRSYAEPQTRHLLLYAELFRPEMVIDDEYKGFRFILRNDTEKFVLHLRSSFFEGKEVYHLPQRQLIRADIEKKCEEYRDARRRGENVTHLENEILNPLKEMYEYEIRSILIEMLVKLKARGVTFPTKVPQNLEEEFIRYLSQQPLEHLRALLWMGLLGIDEKNYSDESFVDQRIAEYGKKNQWNESLLSELSAVILGDIRAFFSSERSLPHKTGEDIFVLLPRRKGNE